MNKKPKCLICKNELKADPNGDYFAGGNILMSFGYGSKHDQLGVAQPPHSDLDKLLACNQIRARICDNCFDEVYLLCEGWKVATKQTEERVV